MNELCLTLLEIKTLLEFNKFKPKIFHNLSDLKTSFLKSILQELDVSNINE